MSTPSRTQAMLSRLLPAVGLLGLAAWTIAGPNGLYDLWVLRHRKSEARAAWSQLEADNDLLVLQNEHLRNDPVVVERALASEHQLVRPGTILYVFEDDEIVQEVR